MLNWEEQQKEAKEIFSQLKESFSDLKEIYPMIDGMEKQYSSKESVELLTVKLFNQFFTFHAGKYTLGEEINAEVKAANFYGGEPFDAYVTVSLDEIDAENDFSVLRFSKITDEKQLLDATTKYIKKLGESMGVDMEKENINLPHPLNEVRQASQIHGSTGWPIFSVYTTEVTMGNVYKIDTTTIDIQL